MKSQECFRGISRANPSPLCGLEVRTLRVKRVIGTCTFLLTSGTRLCCPEAACMQTCGSCSSADKKKFLRTPDPQSEDGD